MAQKILLVDDLDGTTEAEMTLSFALDGQEYAIDLADENYEKYRATLELLAAHGRPVHRESVKVRRTLPGTKTTAPNKTDEIREWLRGQGHKVADRGRIRQDLMDLWETRSRMPQKPAETTEEISQGEETPETVETVQETTEAPKPVPVAEFSATMGEILSLNAPGKNTGKAKAGAK